MCRVVLFAVSLLIPLPLAGQTYRIELGAASSGVTWLPTRDGCFWTCDESGSSSRDRRSPTVAVAIRLPMRGPLSVESGLRIVAKGFHVTGPTFHMVYAEMPLVGVLQTGRESGFFLEAGTSIGVRVQCRRFMDTVDELHEDDCGRTMTSYGGELEPLRRWDLSGNLGIGLRLPTRVGWIVVALRVERSLVDIQPGDSTERMLNRVISLSFGVEWQ